MLKKLTTNPLPEHPEILDIWPHRRSEIIRDISDALNDPEHEQLFLIVHNNKVVGITGYYKYDNQVGLNWHGILQEYSKLGLGLQALKDLIPLACEKYPHAEYLIEELPADREDKLKGFFLKVGFVRTDVLVDKPWITTDTDWIEYRLSLKRYELDPPEGFEPPSQRS